jgi:choline-sulfatase
MPSRPNILIFLADSTQVGHLGCYGDHPSITPHLDRMAAEGIRFARAYATTPLCHPARSAMLTGLYPHVNGMIGNLVEGHPWLRFDRSLPTFYTILRQAGYRCGVAAQHHEPFDRCWVDDLRAGFAVFRQRQIEAGQLYDDPMKVPRTPVEGRPLENLEDVRDQQYLNDGLELLEQYAHQRHPWLLSIEFDGPHPPCLPLRSWWERIQPNSVSLPASVRDPLTDRAPRHRRVRELTGTSAWTDERWREAIRLYRAVIAMQDDYLAQVLTKLKHLGCDENTLVIVTSGHGDLVGHHGILTKYAPSMDETVLRVPLVMRWPGGIVAGQTQEAFVSSTDLLPTLCEVAGATWPSAGHGRSLASFLQGAIPAEWRAGNCRQLLWGWDAALHTAFVSG